MTGRTLRRRAPAPRVPPASGALGGSLLVGQAVRWRARSSAPWEAGRIVRLLLVTGRGTSELEEANLDALGPSLVRRLQVVVQPPRGRPRVLRPAEHQVLADDDARGAR